ncbi:hypothetical protein NEOLI_005120 [Neolecta irregularis DAH-3]|uniref:CWH43-like N-terminal domain-containing protein n=1 Tax=Neolecta irregularis (strain DAH-3) TaxID=1198029 RepID=A0A1U7LP17_NEOID|nr:hypothetical protein NEOLI_005120 [Neolecta irregularis DAH-3]|eukprot:OLL24333.1 hypothetical protein NEOLI_005120 [Neolecta irregularis DAH-3]
MADKYLRLKSHLAGTQDRAEQILAALIIFCGVVAAMTLTMLPFYDDKYQMHWDFACSFVVTVTFTIILSIIEFGRLYKYNRKCKSLVISCIFKVSFLVVAFGIILTGIVSSDNSSRRAVMEWLAAFIFGLVLATMIYDLLEVSKCQESDSDFSFASYEEQQSFAEKMSSTPNSPRDGVGWMCRSLHPRT